MKINDESVMDALAALAMDSGPRAKIKFMDISEAQRGFMDVQFKVRSTDERCGLLVPLPSSTEPKPWVTESTTTPKKWASDFFAWLTSLVEADNFSEADRVAYLQIKGDQLWARP